jgi:transcription elongation factor SPT4
MPRKGIATVKKVDREARYMTVDSDGEEAVLTDSDTSKNGRRSKADTSNEEDDFVASADDEQENVDPAASGERLNLPKAAAESGPHAVPERRQPRQAPGAVVQSKTLESALFPADPNEALPSVERRPDFTSTTRLQPRNQQPTQAPRGRARNSAAPRSRAAGQGRGAPAADTTETPHSRARRVPDTNHRQPAPPANATPLDMPDMIQGGAYIPPNQQRNMRACMVCSVVRTQQQFLTQGCPNCEDILELAGNPEQINDCTSQVFEGLITVADTTRSWVARYQRLEGYHPGVYATQVEGILPDDIISAVENAGINYVPRDGSEQDMLPKD